MIIEQWYASFYSWAKIGYRIEQTVMRHQRVDGRSRVWQPQGWCNKLVHDEMCCQWGNQVSAGPFEPVPAKWFVTAPLRFLVVIPTMIKPLSWNCTYAQWGSCLMTVVDTPSEWCQCFTSMCWPYAHGAVWHHPAEQILHRLPHLSSTCWMTGGRMMYLWNAAVILPVMKMREMFCACA